MPSRGRQVRDRPRTTRTLGAGVNDIRLALGTMLEIGPEGPEQLPAEHPMAGHLDVYQWLTVLQEYLVLGLMGKRTVVKTRGAITDVDGILVGHHHRLDPDATLGCGLGHRHHRRPDAAGHRREPSTSAVALRAPGRPICSTRQTRSATSTQSC